MTRITISRRELLALSAAVCAAAPRDRLLAHTYIFLQDAQRRGTKHVEEVEPIFRTVAAAGFRRVELMSDFLEPDARGRTLATLRSQSLDAPIVYVGGVMHEHAAAAETRRHAERIADAARDAGAVAINTNPSPKPGRGRKSDDELAEQARSLNLLGEALRKRGMMLLYHTHDPEMAENAREWRYVVQHTDPALVPLCMDVHWIYRGGQNPPNLLAEAGKRTQSLHLRNSRNKVWSETFGPGDIEYEVIAQEVKRTGADPFLVVELAYENGTNATWQLEGALRQSREYVERVFL